MDRKNLPEELDLLPLLDDDCSAGTGQRYLKCPVCKGIENHPEPPYMIDGNDDYKAGWHGRGDLMVTPFWGECGSQFQLCVGFHKGNAPLFIRVVKSCKPHGALFD